MAELMTVAEFAKFNDGRGVTRFNSPQKINKAIAKNGAPADTSTGKRMVDPEVWDTWADAQPARLPSVKKGNVEEHTYNSKGLRPDQIRKNKHKVDREDVLLYKSGSKEDTTYVATVGTLTSEGAFVNIDDHPSVHFTWENMNHMIDNGTMIIGQLGDVLPLLGKLMIKQGDRANGKLLVEMGEEEQYKNKRREFKMKEELSNK